jgi:hypothetical protein
MMNQEFFHGDVTPAEIAQALIGEFNRGNLRAQAVEQGNGLAVQIATRPGVGSGGQTALTVTIQNVTDGIAVQLGQQEWMGTAASLGWTALTALQNPLMLLSRLNDIAQDVENLQLSEHVWTVIHQALQARGAAHQLSDRLSRIACEFCGTANRVGEAVCAACGAPLGRSQPHTCPNCGFAVGAGDSSCSNCGRVLSLQS